MQVALTLVLYFGVAIIEGDLMDKIQKHKKGKKLLIFAIVLPSIVAAFRGNTGSDSEMYRIAYEQGINAVHRWVNFEMGYRILVQILHSLYMPYQVLFFVTSFITVSFTLLTILQLKKCIDVRLATYIYITGLYLFSFNAMRQCIAISLCLYGIVLYLKRHLIKGIMMILLASLFHVSALICLTVIVLKCLLNRKNYKIILFCLVIFSFYMIKNRAFLGDIILFMTGKSYYSGYITREAEVDASIMNYYIKASPVLIIGFFNIRNYKDEQLMYSIYALTVIGYIIGSLATVTATQIGRLGDYFAYLEIFLMGFCATQKIRVDHYIVTNKFTKHILYTYFSLLMFYSTFIRNFSELVPYSVFRL